MAAGALASQAVCFACNRKESTLGPRRHSSNLAESKRPSAEPIACQHANLELEIRCAVIRTVVSKLTLSAILSAWLVRVANALQALRLAFVSGTSTCFA